MDTVFVSDLNGDLSLIENLSGDAVLLLGDNISKQAYAHRSIDFLKEETRRVAKESKDLFDHVAWLSGNADLSEHLIKDVLEQEDVQLLTQEYDKIHTSNITRKLGSHVLKRPIISFGPGATIGGTRQYRIEESARQKSEFPQSTISVVPEINPVYSGNLFSSHSYSLAKELNDFILVSHNPPYMGTELEFSTSIGDLDQITKSNVQGVPDSIHVGCVYFRQLIDFFQDRKFEAFFGHIEEKGGEEGLIGETSVYNVAEHPRVINV